MRQSKPSSWFVGFLTLGLLAFGAEVLWLSRRVRTLQAHEREAHAASVRRLGADPATGRFPYLFLLGPDGQPRLLPESGAHSGTLVLFTSPGCDACPAVAEDWNALADLARAACLPVVLVSVGASAAPPQAALALEPHRFVGPTDVLVRAIPGFPTTLALDRQGVVQLAVTGELAPEHLERFLAWIEAEAAGARGPTTLEQGSPAVQREDGS